MDDLIGKGRNGLGIERNVFILKKITQTKFS